MAYQPRVWAYGDDLLPEYFNTVEHYLGQFGNYQGVLEHISDLPAVLTDYVVQDWFLVMHGTNDRPEIYMVFYKTDGTSKYWRAMFQTQLISGSDQYSIYLFLGVMPVAFTGTTQRIEDAEFYSITSVNLLGDRGNFEYDIDLDGLADGWELTHTPSLKERSTLTKVVGNYAQHVTYTNTTGALTSFGMKSNFFNFCPATETLFLSAFVKKGETDTATSCRFRVIWYRENRTIKQEDTVVVTLGEEADERFVRVGAKFVAPSDSVYFRVGIEESLEESEVADMYVDGFMVMNLSKMGNVPPALVSYLSISTFVGMSVSYLLQMFEYHDAVPSLSGDAGESAVNIFNCGKNLVRDSYYREVATLVPVNASIKRTGERSILVEVDAVTGVDAYDLENASLVFPVSGNEDIYTLSFIRTIEDLTDGKGVYEELLLFNSDGLLLETISGTPSSSSGKMLASFRAYREVAYVGLRLNVSDSSHVARVTYSQFQLEYNTTSTDFEPGRDNYFIVDYSLNSLAGLYDRGVLSGYEKKLQSEEIWLDYIYQWDSGSSSYVPYGVHQAGNLSKMSIENTVSVIVGPDKIPYFVSVASSGAILDIEQAKYFSVMSPGMYRALYVLRDPYFQHHYVNNGMVLYAGTNIFILPSHYVAVLKTHFDSSVAYNSLIEGGDFR